MIGIVWTGRTAAVVAQGFFFIYHRGSGRSQVAVMDVGGLFLSSHSVGVLIWFVTARAGGPIHLKLPGRNPLGGNVGIDAHGPLRSPASRSNPRCFLQAIIFIQTINNFSTANMKVSSIDCRRLRRIIRKECGSCLIVDCRPYFSFTNSSIKGSVNVNLNSVVVRRSRGGPVPLQFVIPDERALYRLREGSISAIVALDDRTSHWQKLKKDSVAQIVINTLSHLASGTSICFLKGGYENFHSQYPELCTEVKTTDQSGTETERRVSHSEKLSHHKPDYDQGKPVEILPFLYLGSAYHASRHDYLSDLHITALLNVSRRDLQPAKGHYDYKWIPVEDSHMADISSHFQEAIEFIDRIKQSGGKVLVHCEAGISRSPTICMAYIMRTQQLRLDEAFDIIKQRRAVISPNFSFMGQLLQFESEVLSSALALTVTPEPATPCIPESASFFANDFSATFSTKNFEPSVFTLPTSCLQSPVHHQLKLSPITALP